MTAPDVLITAGIDVGSSSIKTVVFQDRGPSGHRMLAGLAERLRRRDPLDVATETFEKALSAAGIARGDVDYIATTGEGENVPFRTGHFYGMTTHARGGLFLDPAVRAVVDIGALHTRAVLMDDRAKVLGYRMTSQCASGSGQFLENICRYLGVTIDEIGPLSLEADAPESCSSICAVLAETDVINMVSRGVSIPNILRGIHDSMAGRYVKLATAAGANGVVLVTGGLSRDAGLLAAMRDANRDLDIRTHEHAVLAGAIGAALWGGYRARRLREKGLSLTGGAA
ncbi:MAG: benzoyl-CoA reductase subunit D [Planctomycetes bacterium]|nr:benzoyl-CoA reductase subunit D [Planctomycetota bacterium]